MVGARRPKKIQTNYKTRASLGAMESRKLKKHFQETRVIISVQKLIEKDNSGNEKQGKYWGKGTSATPKNPDRKK